MIDTEQTKGLFERATVVPPGADGFESQSRQVRLLPAHGAKPGTERRAEMERELEKTLLEIECSIKDHERRGNTHTQSVLEQARDIIGMCAQAARTPSDLKEILDRETTGGWIPVEERLPENNKLVLVWARSTARGADEWSLGSCDLSTHDLTRRSTANTHNYREYLYTLFSILYKTLLFTLFHF